MEWLVAARFQNQIQYLRTYHKELQLHLNTSLFPGVDETNLAKILTLKDDEFERYKHEMLQGCSHVMIDAQQFAE